MADRLQLIRTYYGLGMTQKQITTSLAQRHGIIISIRHLQRILRSEGMTRRHYADIGEAVAFIQQQLMGSGSLHGSRYTLYISLHTSLSFHRLASS